MAAVVLAAAGITAAVPLTQASAGTSCSSVFGCSRVTNHSAYEVLAYHDWNCGGSTGTSSTGCTSGDSIWLSPGSGTPSNQDWDVVQVDARWCYKIHFNNWYGKSWTVTYNRLGQSSPVYVKVEDGSVADVIAQSATGCP